MIKQIHVNECDSTQDLLKEQLNNFPHQVLLVSCEKQLRGRGRGENIWEAMPGTLCFSLSIDPHSVTSFTALEISLLILNFFKIKGADLKLKWPNDLWNIEGKKCGGILVQSAQNIFIAGIGLNLISNSELYGGVFSGPMEVNKKNWAMEIATYITENRFKKTDELKKQWTANCGHIDSRITITEVDQSYQGIFIGVGELGEALVKDAHKVHHIYNGTLRLEEQL